MYIWESTEVSLSVRVYTLPSICSKICSVYCIWYRLKRKLDMSKACIDNSPVFSNSVFGVSGRLIISISCVKINGIYVLVSGPAENKRR